MQIVTLTTDFGTRDWFVGTMKGVMLGINPRADIVDLTHEIPAGDIRAGAFALMAGCHYFPKGTVHVAVVDPGVGGPRRAIAVQTNDYFFVGPDNGVLSWALAREQIKTVRQLEQRKYLLDSVSRTFHGRDIFAPVAAHLSRGPAIQRLGREVKDWVRLPWPQPKRSRGTIRAKSSTLTASATPLPTSNPNRISMDELSRVKPLAGERRVASWRNFMARRQPIFRWRCSVPAVFWKSRSTAVRRPGNLESSLAMPWSCGRNLNPITPQRQKLVRRRA